jgi:putative YhbY family RNA-binding protein
MDLTPEQRRALRAKAHHLHPVVSIGQHGLTPPVLNEIDVALKAHALIKIRVHSDDRAAREAMLADIAARLHAAPVQHLGKLLVLWRERDEDEHEGERAPTPAKAARKPAKKPTRKPAKKPGKKAGKKAAKRPGASTMELHGAVAARAPKPIDAGRVPRGTPPPKRRRAAHPTPDDATTSGPSSSAAGTRRRRTSFAEATGTGSQRRGGAAPAPAGGPRGMRGGPSGNPRRRRAR